jgi:mannose-1-phosphate guanylyltransferase
LRSRLVLLRSEVQPFHAMVLAAGRGTRLGPISEEIPKPLLPVGATSILRNLVEGLRSRGAATLCVNAFHRAAQVVSEIESWPFLVHVSMERELLGTAGGIRAAAPFFGSGPVLVQNGDIVGSEPLSALLGASDDDPLVFAVVSRAKGTGTVGLGAESQVVRLRGEVFGEEVASGDYVGASRLSEAAVRELPSQGCLVGDYALPLLRRGVRVGARVIPGSFLDVGDPASYLVANLSWLRENTESPHVFLGPNSKLAPTVEPASVLLSAGAELEGEGRAERVVLLPGARASAPLCDAIVTPSGRVIHVSLREPTRGL